MVVRKWKISNSKVSYEGVEMDYDRYELVKQSLSSEAKVIVDMYKERRIPDKQLCFTLDDNMSLSDNDVFEIFRAFDDGFNELKKNNVINNYKRTYDGKKIIFEFMC